MTPSTGYTQSKTIIFSEKNDEKEEISKSIAEAEDDVENSDDDICDEDNSDDDENPNIDTSIGTKKEKKTSKKNDTEKFNKLLDRLIDNFKDRKSAIESTVFTVGKQGYVGGNMTNANYMIPGYGYLMIFLKKAESYYYHQKTKKINISKLRNDIDITKTNLRIAISKQDTNLQQKLCDKLIEQKKNLEEALESIKNVEQKNTMFDYVRAAIQIVRKNNERSLRFTQMFRDRIYMQNSGTTYQTETEQKYTETKVVSVTKSEQKSSIFGKKKLGL